MEKEYTNLKILQDFSIDNLPDLDVVTLGALELFDKEGLPEVNLPDFKKPVIAGSGNARVTSEIIFSNKEAVFAGENNYKEAASQKDVDGALIFSSSGNKHAPLQTKACLDAGLKTYLITCNPNSEAGELKGLSGVILTKKNKEPYTYNTSTYLGWILALTKENPQEILDYINNTVKEKLPNNFSDYSGFLLITPNEFEGVNGLLNTKFIELFGRRVARDIKTYEQMKHAITVVPNKKELCIAFGEKEDFYFENDILHIPLPDNASYGTMMAIGYYVIGNIQKQRPPFFKNNISKYCKEAGIKAFGKEINPIVE
jgi:hypothetical protein